ncbi:MAG: response regulator [Ilumatobacteraceae bacterium]
MGEHDSRVQVVIIDDHRMFGQSLARMLEDEDDIAVVGLAENGTDGVHLVDQHEPQVVLVDYQMPGQNGVDVAGEIKRRHPSMMVVMLTGAADDRVILAAIEAGCSGFLTKDNAAAQVVEAVRGAAAGEALIAPSVLARLLPRLKRTYRSLGDDLTERERDVLQLLARGLPNKAIAAQLHLSLNTIRNYVQSVLTKLGAHSKLEAVSTAVREGIIDYAGDA